MGEGLAVSLPSDMKNFKADGFQMIPPETAARLIWIGLACAVFFFDMLPKGFQ